MSSRLEIQQSFFRLFKNLVSIVTLLFILLLFIILHPGKRTVEDSKVFILVTAGIWIYYLAQSLRKIEKKNVKDIIYAVYLILILWELVTRVYDILPKILFPSPGDVFDVFVIERKLMISGLFSSLYLLFTGFSIALLFGNFLGLFVGWNDRLRRDFFPVAKVLSPIPPMIYTPYLIALMPTFKSASIAVIAFGLFWPTFMNMINRVGSMDRRIIDSAKVMNVNTTTMLLKVILPYSIPGIVGGLRVQLSTTFMVLVMAEMIGAQSGLGFFVKKYSDYADYTRVVAGIIFIGVVITALNGLLTIVEKKTVKWKMVG